MSRPALALLCLLAASACREPAADAWARARAKHQELVLAGVNPSNPKFDELLALLAAVPPGSPHSAEARKLERAVGSARVHLRRPLAVAYASAGDLPAEMTAQAEACARLAAQLGRDGGVGAEGLRALAECNQRVERLDSRCHSEHDGGMRP